MKKFELKKTSFFLKEISYNKCKEYSVTSDQNFIR